MSHNWRLSSPKREMTHILPPEWTSVHLEKDLEFVNGILRSWGFAIVGDWDREDKNWVVPIQCPKR